MGIRLPVPSNCPKAISELMKQCFMEEPKKRPSFSEIKSSILHSYQEIIQATNRTTKEEKECNKIVQYADIQMENSYSNMKKQNRDFQEGRNFSNNEDHLMCLNPSLSFCSASENDKIHESLQYLTPLTKNNTFSDSDAIIGNKLLFSNNAEKDSKKSYVNIEYKKCLSSSTKDVRTSLLSSANLLSKRPSSKSCPNPLYLLNLDDVESLRRISDSPNMNFLQGNML